MSTISENHPDSLIGTPSSRAIEFAWPLPDEDWLESTPDYDGKDFLAATDHTEALTSPLVALIAPSLEEGETIEVRPIGFGTGFEVEGIHLVIWTTITAAANIEGLIALGVRVKGWWRALVGARLASGRELLHPALSLGSVIALAAADFADRVPDARTAALLSGVRHPAPEQGYSGNDVFTVVFGSDARTWTYLIDADGRVLSFAEGLPLVPWAAPYWGAGGLVDPVAYPMLGDGPSGTTEEE